MSKMSRTHSGEMEKDAFVSAVRRGIQTIVVYAAVPDGERKLVVQPMARTHRARQDDDTLVPLYACQL